MEKQESQSKWDDLARVLGAEIPPETRQREEAISRASQEVVQASTEHSRDTTTATHTPLPKRSARDWDSLASDLGLPPAEPVVASTVEVPREEPQPEPRQRDREPTRARRPEQHDRERRPRREPSEHRRDDRGQRSRREHHEKRRERQSSESDVEHKELAPSAADVEVQSVAPPTSDEPPQKPAVSLWHKIFGSPAEQTAKISDDVNRPEAVEPSDFRDEPRAAGSDFADTLGEEPMPLQEQADELAPRGDTSITGEETAPSDRGRGRPRRRRGRGRGRKPEGRQTEGRSSEHHGERPRSERPRPETEDEFADDQFIDDDDTDESFQEGAVDTEDGNGVPTGAAAPRRTSSLQRTIPSWDEAIGFIVDTNMQTRSQRRPPSRPGSRENSSRGRSRGRRKS